MRDDQPQTPAGDTDQPEELGTLVPVERLPGLRAPDRDTCQAQPAQARDDMEITPAQKQRIHEAIETCVSELSKPLAVIDNSAFVGVSMILRGAHYLRNSYEAEDLKAADHQVASARMSVTDDLLYGKAFDLLVGLAAVKKVAL